MAGEVMMKMSEGRTGVWRSWCSHGGGLAAPMWARHVGQLGAAPAEQARRWAPHTFLQTPSHPARRQGLLCWQKMWGAHVWAPAGPWPLTTRLVQPQWGPPGLRPWASWGSPFLYFNYITNIVFLCFSSGAMRQYWPAVGRMTASTAACSSHRV